MGKKCITREVVDVAGHFTSGGNVVENFFGNNFEKHGCRCPSTWTQVTRLRVRPLLRALIDSKERLAVP